MDLEVVWDTRTIFPLAKDRGMWRLILNAVMKLRVS